jgi:NH3-dependent NAD+ synthetase
MRLMRLYFDLCYDEYSLYYTYKKLDEVLWKDWKKGIEATLGKKSFQEAWKKIEQTAGFSQNYNKFINEFFKANEIPLKK